MVNIAVIGDIHGHFGEEDVFYFNEAPYDLLLCVGDLGGYRPGNERQVAGMLALINKPLLLIPGNHDATTLVQLAAEVTRQDWLAQASSMGQEGRVRHLKEQLGNVTVCGFSTHDFCVNGYRFAVIGARPFSMGGDRLGYRPYLSRKFGVDSLSAAADRLQQCIDETDAENLVFLAHNGPTGLGNQPHDIWGCDFKPELGDFGDRDLRQAIEYARGQGRRVHAVAAGHMHHALATGGSRVWLKEEEGIFFINAARVPRVYEGTGQQVRHHVHLRIDGARVEVREVLIS